MPRPSVAGSTPDALRGHAVFRSGQYPAGNGGAVNRPAGGGFTAGELDGQSLEVVFGGRIRSGDVNGDYGRFELEFLDASDVSLGLISSDPSVANDRWDLNGGQMQLPNGARKLIFRYIADRESGTPNDAFLDAAFLYLVDEGVAPNQGAYGNTI